MQRNHLSARRKRVPASGGCRPVNTCAPTRPTGLCSTRPQSATTSASFAEPAACTTRPGPRGGEPHRSGTAFRKQPEGVRELLPTRQVQLLTGRLYFALPEGGKTRIVDTPRSVATELGAYFLDHPAGDVELPWGGPEPRPGEAEPPARPHCDVRNAISANIFNDEAWKPALAAAGVIPAREKGARWKASREDGFHVLRHTYASVLLEAGQSTVTLARWPGHSSPTTPSTPTPTSCRKRAARDVRPSARCSARCPSTYLRASPFSVARRSPAVTMAARNSGGEPCPFRNRVCARAGTPS